MAKVGLAVPYFGVLPSGFELWLKGASRNPDIDFHLIGDCFVGVDTPKNIYIHNWTYGDLQEALRRELGARNLKQPYKLCDFKPSYRILFAQFLSGYDVWGFTDIDLVYGDISRMLDFSKFPQGWGRIFDYGHLSLFRNDPIINLAFANAVRGPHVWPFVRDSRNIWVYDERYEKGLGGVSAAILAAGYSVHPHRDLFSDVRPARSGFFDEPSLDAPNLFYLWDDGRLWKAWKHGDELLKLEQCYVHFQKRKVSAQWVNHNRAIITPDHWPRVDSVEYAAQLLDSMQSQDQRVRGGFEKRETASRIKKWMSIAREWISLPGGLAAARTFCAYWRLPR